MPAEPVLRVDFQLSMADFKLMPRFEIGSNLAVIFGESGAGKSLTLRVIAGLGPPVEGMIHLHNKVLQDSQVGIRLPPQERNIGYVPQNYGLFPHRTVYDNICYGLAGWERGERNARVEELLSVMRLQDQANRKPHELSGGQQQRTALARALARKPGLLLMDEPFAALDEDLRIHLREEVKNIQKRVQIPVLFVTHRLTEAYNLAEQLIVIDQGRVIQDGSRDLLFRSPRTPKVAKLMGMTNILETVLLETADTHSVVDWNGVILKIGQKSDLEVGSILNLGLRPEEVMVIRRNRLVDPDFEENFFRGILVDDQPLGFDHLVTLEIETQSDPPPQLKMRIPHPIFLKLELTINQTRNISIKPSSFHVFPPPGSGAR